MTATGQSPLQGMARRSLEAGLGVAVGVVFVLASALIAAVAGERGTNDAASRTVLGLMALGLVVGLLVRYLATRPLVSIAACLAIWVVLATSPIFPLGFPEWARFSWNIGDLGALTVLSGVLLGLAVRGFRIIRDAHPRDTTHG